MPVVILFWLLLLTVGGGSEPAPTVVQRWYTQPLDHFVVGVDTTFEQRAFVDTTYRQGRPVDDGTPILAFLGGEASIETWLGGGGIVTLVASRFEAVIIYIEHRFYGQSVPLGSIDAAMMDPAIRGCLSSPQALADFANVLLSMKTELMIPHSPVIVFGGFYSGMLAAFFRMKYPFIADGALASSAPILGTADPGVEYCDIVSRDFASENIGCYGYISESWRHIDEIASEPEGLDTLSQIFSTCAPLSTIYELKQYLALVYNYAAQYDRPTGLIARLCSNISDSDASRDGILRGIGYALMSFTQQQSCNNISLTNSGLFLVADGASRKAWDWQICTDLVIRQGCDDFTMFEKSTFNASGFMEACFATFGVFPNPSLTSMYFGQDLKKALKRSASNIVFSNGLMDPYSGASILEDISDTVVAITTKEGSHCLDLNPPRDNDPKWLKHQREKELRIIGHWIETANSPSNQMSSLGVWLLLISLYFLV